MSEPSSAGQGRRSLLPAWVPARLSARLSAALRRARQRQPPLAGPADIRWCYRLLLGREPEAHGYRGYLHLVTNNAVSRDDLVSFFVSSPEFRSRLVETFGSTQGTPIGTSIGELTIYVDSEDTAIGSSLRRSGVYEPAVTATVRKYLKKGDCFVDCGASFGYFSALAGVLVGPEGSVISFEPGPQNQSLLLLNLTANGIVTGEVHQVALSDNVGIYRYGGTGANGAISPFDGDPNHLGTYDLVRSTTLDNVVGSRKIDMMKVDVEGAEGQRLPRVRTNTQALRPGPGVRVLASVARRHLGHGGRRAPRVPGCARLLHRPRRRSRGIAASADGGRDLGPLRSDRE